MNRLRVTVLAGAILSVGFGGRFVYGQDEERVEGQVNVGELPEIEPWIRNLVRVDRQSPPYPLALDGVHGTTDQEMGPIESDGTYVRADQFRIDPAADIVEAVGNVTIVVRDGDSTVRIRADRITIEGRQ
jgi:hypothetical protein